MSIKPISLPELICLGCQDKHDQTCYGIIVLAALVKWFAHMTRGLATQMVPCTEDRGSVSQGAILFLDSWCLERWIGKPTTESRPVGQSSCCDVEMIW